MPAMLPALPVEFVTAVQKLVPRSPAPRVAMKTLLAKPPAGRTAPTRTLPSGLMWETLAVSQALMSTPPAVRTSSRYS